MSPRWICPVARTLGSSKFSISCKAFRVLTLSTFQSVMWCATHSCRKLSKPITGMSNARSPQPSSVRPKHRLNPYLGVAYLYDYLYTQSSTGCGHPHYDSEKACATDHGVPGLS